MLDLQDTLLGVTVVKDVEGDCVEVVVVGLGVGTLRGRD